MQISDMFSGRLSGPALIALARAAKNPALAEAGLGLFRRELGIDLLASRVPARFTLDQDLSPLRAHETSRLAVGSTCALPVPPPWSRNSASLVEAYLAQSLDPSALCERVFAQARALTEHQPLLRCFYTELSASAHAEAAASSARYRAGSTLGPLDGVPIVVKEQLAIAGLPHRMGTDLRSDRTATDDATVVARLRAVGAVVVAQTAMTELGLSVLGANPQRPPLRNPHHFDHSAGGSSTGSGVAVATGLVPLAVAVDGGGSIRIPAALVGVYGLKPTFGLVSRAGDLAGGSLAHVGPIASSTLDLANFLDAVVGLDARDPHTRHAPTLQGTFASALGRRVDRLRIGVPEALWRLADPQVREACERALSLLEAAGAERVKIHLEAAEHAPAAGFVTIGAETYSGMAGTFESERHLLSAEMQTLVSFASRFGADEYFAAQALREHLRHTLVAALREVDVIALPSTAKTAPELYDSDDRTGRMDAQGANALCKYAFLANLTGLPAATAPVGIDGNGLPIGLQILGDAWDDGLVLSVLAELERTNAARVARPAHHVDLLR